MKIRFAALLLLALSSVSAADPDRPKFFSILAIPGVTKVDYQAPFLWVVCNDRADLAAIDAAIGNVARGGIEPDLEALGGKYNLNIVDKAAYARQRDVYTQIKQANSPEKLAQLFASSLSAHLYELDWDAPDAVATRKVYRRGPPSGLPSEMETVRSLVARFRPHGNRPDRLLCFRTSLPLGALVYPVYGDSIRIRQDAASLSAFLERIEPMIAPATWAAPAEPVVSETEAQPASDAPSETES